MAVLVILTGKQSGRKIRLPEKTVIIGRDEGSFLRIASADVSRQHCELAHIEGGWVLRDLKSQNGTFLNGKRVRGEVPLQIGDELLVGHMKFQWEGPRTGGETVLEDSIAEWLSEHDTSMPSVKAPGDTTILDGSHLQDAAPPAATSPAPETGAARPSSESVAPPRSDSAPAAKTVETRQTLADEARAVIQHFVEHVGDTKPPALLSE